MRIGHQIFNTLDEWTVDGIYDVGTLFFFENVEGTKSSLKRAYINYEEKQVYLVVTGENSKTLHVTIHGFLNLMGGTQRENYLPLYQLRDEMCVYKRKLIKAYKKIRSAAEVKLSDSLIQ